SGVSGLQALEKAGFSVQTIDNGGFVCQIDGKPDRSVCKDSANGTSWYYYYAGSDGTWKYSSLGAGNRTVIEGGYEGWNFGPKTPPDYTAESAARPSDDTERSNDTKRSGRTGATETSNT